MSNFYYEKAEYVCKECKGDNWIANQFWDNSNKQWGDDPYDLYWCYDCKTVTDIIEMEEDDE